MSRPRSSAMNATDISAVSPTESESSSYDQSMSTFWQLELHISSTRGSASAWRRSLAKAIPCSSSSVQPYSSSSSMPFSSSVNAVIFSPSQVTRLLFELTRSGESSLLHTTQQPHAPSRPSNSSTTRAGVSSSPRTCHELRTLLVVEHDTACAANLREEFMDKIPCSPSCERTFVHVRHNLAEISVSSVSCGVCLDGFQNTVRDLVLCSGCTSRTCKKCYATWIETRVMDGRVGTELTCAHCLTPVPTDDVALYCGSQVARRHAYFVSRLEHRNNPHAIWCADETCRAVLYEGTEQYAMKTPDLYCDRCDTRTCVKCHEKGHVGTPCVKPAGGIGGEVKNKIWEKIHAKRCPGCEAWIQRDGGCSNMKCTHCGIMFCYRCRKRFVEVEGHTPRGDCVCSKANEAGMWAVIIGGILVVVPVGLAATAVLGPPLALGYVLLPKRKQKKVKAKWKKWMDALKDE